MVSKKLKSFNADEFMEGTANNYSLLNDRFRPEADVLDVSTKSGIGQAVHYRILHTQAFQVWKEAVCA